MKIQADKTIGAGLDEERALLRRIVQRDRSALTELYRIYQPRLFKFIFRLTRSFTITDELVNDVMLVVWRKAANFRGASKVSTWIFGIAYRQTMHRVTRKRLRLVPYADLESLAADGDATGETEDWVRRGISALPAAQQLTVVLVFYLGLSYEETAEVTQCPVNTVKTRMFHARRKLKGILENAALPGHTTEENSHD